MVCRVLIGVAQGFVIPSIHSLLAAAMQGKDKSKAVSFVTSGMYLGSSSCYIVMPSIVSSYGTGVSLAVLGGFGLSWLCAWLLLKDRLSLTVPGKEDKTADKTAVVDLEKSVPGEGSKAAEPKGPQKIPWSRMMQSTAMWAIITNNFESVIKVQLTGLGLAKALPYLMMFGASNFGGIAGEFLIVTLNFSTKWARTILNTAGLGLSAVTIFCMYKAETKAQGLFIVTASLSLLGVSRGGFAVNHMDIAPEFAGVIMGI